MSDTREDVPPSVKLAPPIERRIREIVAEEIAESREARLVEIAHAINAAITRIKSAQTARPDYDSGGTMGGIR